MLYILDGDYVKRIQVLYFINSSRNPVSIKEISDYTGSTRKTISSLLTIIKKDIESLSFDLIETKEKKYFLVSNTTNNSISLDDYFLMGGKKSLIFTIIEELFYKEEINTIQFCEDRYISQATFSRGKKKLSESLMRYNLSLPTFVKRGIEGNEYKIRFFYFYFFNSFYKSIEWPFEESAMKDIDSHFYLKIEKIFGSLSTNKKRKLYILIYIVKKRISQGHFVRQGTISYEGLTEYAPILELFSTYFKKYKYNNEQLIVNEVNFFIYGLLSNEIININKQCLFPILKKNKQVMILTKIWILEFKQTFNQTLVNEEETLLFYKLSLLHLKYENSYFPPLFFKYESIDTDIEPFDKLIYQKTKKMYQNLSKLPIYRNFLNSYFKKDENYKIIEDYYSYIYYYFLSSEKVKPISIFIDDSINEIEKSILKKRLELVFGDNIAILDIEDDDVELILTSQGHPTKKIEKTIYISYIEENNFFEITDKIQEKIYIQLSKNEVVKY